MKTFMVMIDRWLGSTKIEAMEPGEEAGYFRLLLHAAKNELCSLPDDDYELARLSRLGRLWFEKPEFSPVTRGERIRQCFEVSESGRLINAVLLKDKDKYEKAIEQKRKAGKARQSKTTSPPSEEHEATPQKSAEDQQEASVKPAHAQHPLSTRSADAHPESESSFTKVKEKPRERGLVSLSSNPPIRMAATPSLMEEYPDLAEACAETWGLLPKHLQKNRGSFEREYCLQLLKSPDAFAAHGKVAEIIRARWRNSVEWRDPRKDTSKEAKWWVFNRRWEEEYVEQVEAERIPTKPASTAQRDLELMREQEELSDHPALSVARQKAGAA